MAKKSVTIGILAHVDAGKTTLSEGILHTSGVIRDLGKVDCGNTTLDNDELEKLRGITIFSKQTYFDWGNTEFYLLDTPGHPDFVAEMERTLDVLDYAILVISGREGIQSHTKTIWNLLEKYDIPTFVFINKMDISIKDKNKILIEINDFLGNAAIEIQNTLLKKKKLNDNLVEKLTLVSENLTHAYFEKGNLGIEDLKLAVKNREIFPCIFGSAIKEDGVRELLDIMDHLTIPSEYSHDFGGRVFKIAEDEKGTRLTFIKITGGELNIKDTIRGEKVNEIRIYSGKKFRNLSKGVPGMVCGITGLSNTKVGMGLGVESNGKIPQMEPFLTYRVLIQSEVDSGKVFKNLSELSEEDPKLNVVLENGEIKIRIMGKLQLEIIKALVKKRFGYDIDFDRGNIIYKETLAEGTLIKGRGHFEPLGHYAEVHLLIEAGERGSGVVVDNQCPENFLENIWQRLILEYLNESPHKGVMLGGNITDVKITLISGKSHRKYSSSEDFREATFRALRQGLLKAKDKDNIRILEPWIKLEAEFPKENLGKFMTDIERMGGDFGSPEQNDKNIKIFSRAPTGEIQGYLDDFLSYTSGQGKINLQADGYDYCHNTNDVLEKSEYDPIADKYNSGDSIFSYKGINKTISWDKSDDYMDISDIEKSNDFNEESYLYRESAQDIDVAELKRIFEMTYGPVKSRNNIGSNKKKFNIDRSFDPIQKSNKNSKDTKPRENYILIDGYNLIYAWEELKELSAIDFGSARDRLIDILCNYQGYSKNKIILVFDAYKVQGGRGSTEKVRNIYVVYTREAETADMYIEKVTHSMAKENNIRVVTSDALEQLITLGHGALRTSSSEFIKEIHDVNERIRDLISQG